MLQNIIVSPLLDFAWNLKKDDAARWKIVKDNKEKLKRKSDFSQKCLLL